MVLVRDRGPAAFRRRCHFEEIDMIVRLLRGGADAAPGAGS